MQHTKTGAGGGSVSFHRGFPPPLTQAEKWFEFTDVRNNGAITSHEVLNSMLLHIRPNSRYEERFIKGKIEDSWRNYSTHGSKVTKEAFISKRMARFLISVENQYSQKFNVDRSNQSTRDLFQGVNGRTRGQLKNGGGSSRELMQNSSSSSSRFLGLGSKPKSCKNFGRGSGSNKKPIPSLSTKPKEWFSHFDVVDRGALNKIQIINGLIATFDANSEKEQTAIRENVGRIWSKFVTKQDGTISKFEFLLSNGLADKLKSMDLTVPQPQSRNSFVSATATGTSSSSPQLAAIDPPSLTTPSLLTRGAWFDYFDTNNYGHLTQNQVIHGLIVTFRAKEVVQQNNISHFIQQLWPSYIGNANDCLSRDGFIINNGFADVLIQNSSTLKNSTTPADAAQSDGVEIKVNIPQGMEPGQRLKVQSPRSSDMVVLAIPEQNRWGGGSDGEPYFFTVVL